MADLDSVQDEINNKLEHGFDTRHIYQMFSTFVATIKNQANQIEEMQEHAERAEAQIENMGLTIRNMEMNIQGFVTLPPDDEDEDTLMAQRPAITSRPASGHGDIPPNRIENAVRSIPGDDKLIKPNQWQESNSRPASGTITPQHEQVKSQSGRRKSSARSWKYKKRRIIRQVSLKLREEEAADIAAEQDEKETPKQNLATTEEALPVENDSNVKTEESNIDIPSENVPVTTETELETDEAPLSEDKNNATTEQKDESSKESQQSSPRTILPPREESSPRVENVSSPRGQISQDIPEAHVITEPVQKEPSTQIESSRNEEHSGQKESSGQVEPTSARGVPSQQVSPRPNISPRPQESSGKPPTGKSSSRTDVHSSEPLQPQSRQTHSSRRSSRDRDMTSADVPSRSRRSSKRLTPEYGGSDTPPMSHRSRQGRYCCIIFLFTKLILFALFLLYYGTLSSTSGYYDEVPQIDPTQTVNYRIAALEARLAKMTDLLESQQDELDECK